MVLSGPVIDNNYIFASPAAELLAGHIKTPLPQILGHNSAEVRPHVPDQGQVHAEHQI